MKNMKTINKILIGIGIITVAKNIKDGIEHIYTEIEKKKIDTSLSDEKKISIDKMVNGLSGLAKDMNDKTMNYDELIKRLKNMGFKKNEEKSE